MAPTYTQNPDVGTGITCVRWRAGMAGTRVDESRSRPDLIEQSVMAQLSLDGSAEEVSPSRIHRVVYDGACGAVSVFLEDA